MDDVNVLGTKFAGHGLSDRAQAELGGSKCRKSFPAAHACRRAGEENGATAAGEHVFRGFAADEETAVTRKLPCLEEQLFGGLQQGLVDVRTRIVERDFDRADLFLDLREQSLHIGFLSGVHAHGVNLMAFGCHIIDEALRFGGIATGDDDLVAAPGETFRDSGSDGIARANQYDHAFALSHVVLPIVLIWYFDS